MSLCRRLAFGLFTAFLVALFIPVAAALDIRVDDSNSTFFNFIGGWHTVNERNPCVGCAADVDQGRVFNRTYRDGNSANSAGGSCRFFGSAISIFGVDVLQQGRIRFRLDENSAVVYEEQRAQTVYNALFFRATNLATDVEHSLEWTVQTSSVGGTAIVLDYAVVTVPDPISTTSSASSTSSSTSTTSSATQTETSAPERRGKQTGAIVSGVVGGVLGVMLLVGLFFLCVRRRKIQHSSESGETKVEPFRSGHRVQPSESTVYDPYSDYNSVAPRSDTTGQATSHPSSGLETRVRQLEQRLEEVDPDRTSPPSYDLGHNR